MAYEKIGRQFTRVYNTRRSESVGRIPGPALTDAERLHVLINMEPAEREELIRLPEIGFIQRRFAWERD